MGVLIDRLGPRRIGLIGVLLMGAAVALLSTATGTMTNWLALWAIVAIGFDPGAGDSVDERGRQPIRRRARIGARRHALRLFDRRVRRSRSCRPGWSRLSIGARPSSGLAESGRSRCCRSSSCSFAARRTADAMNRVQSRAAAGDAAWAHLGGGGAYVGVLSIAVCDRVLHVLDLRLRREFRADPD